MDSDPDCAASLVGRGLGARRNELLPPLGSRALRAPADWLIRAISIPCISPYTSKGTLSALGRMPWVIVVITPTLVAPLEHSLTLCLQGGRVEAQVLLTSGALSGRQVACGHHVARHPDVVSVVVRHHWVWIRTCVPWGDTSGSSAFSRISFSCF